MSGVATYKSIKLSMTVADFDIPAAGHHIPLVKALLLIDGVGLFPALSQDCSFDNQFDVFLESDMSECASPDVETRPLLVRDNRRKSSHY